MYLAYVWERFVIVSEFMYNTFWNDCVSMAVVVRMLEDAKRVFLIVVSSSRDVVKYVASASGL